MNAPALAMWRLMRQRRRQRRFRSYQRRFAHQSRQPFCPLTVEKTRRATGGGLEWVAAREWKEHLSPRRPTVRGGIDLGGTKIQAVTVDGKWQVIGQSRRPTPTEGGPGDVAEQMADAMRDAALDAGTRPSTLASVGVGSPGDVNETTGAVSQARNLPGWDGTFELGPWLTKSLGSPVSVGNDVGVATGAEAELGAGRPYRSLLGVFWGTGVGGGVILNGEQWLGRGAAGEIGHMVVKRDGARCTCGRRGCMEAYAGRAAMEIKARKEHEAGAKTDLFKIMKKHDRDRLTSGIWSRALDKRDPRA